jgi:uncharacterized protein RhaS with RHS repeats
MVLRTPNYFRDYEAGTGRYLQSDPIGLDSGDFNTYSYVGSDPLIYVDQDGEARSYAGRTKALKRQMDDPKVASCIRGWLKQEFNHRKRGGRGKNKTKYIRNPPGMDNAHPADQPSVDGNDYSCTCLQDELIHDIQTAVEGKAGRYKK